MNVTEAAAQLREAEQRARERLERGCRDDATSLRRLIAGPLRKARLELRERILSIGSLDPVSRRNLLAQEAEEVAMRCAHNALANTDVRFRARFGMYATAIADEQEALLGRPPRRITLPHLTLDDEPSVVPRSEVSLASVDAWIEELGNTLCLALEHEAWRAYGVTAERGSRSLARARIALRLRQKQRASPA